MVVTTPLTPLHMSDDLAVKHGVSVPDGGSSKWHGKRLVKQSCKVSRPPSRDSTHHSRISNVVRYSALHTTRRARDKEARLITSVPMKPL